MADSIKSVDVPSVHGMVALNPDGTAIGTPVGGATSANQTNGSQKSQIVDAGGEAVTITGGKLDVNATASLAGESIPASGATTAVAVQIVDGSGNQIASFGGGTQYTEGDTDASITGTASLVEGAANALAVMTQPLTDTQLRATDVKITLDGESVPVTGTFWQATQPVSGTVAVTNAGITTIAGAVSGTEMQVDVLTMPTTTVTATDLDIRPLVNTDVVTAELSAVDNAVLDTIAAKDFATQTTLAAINAKMVTGTDIGDVTINNTTSSPVPVQPPLSGFLNVSIDQTGDNNGVDVLTIAAGDNNIGNVDIASALPAGSALIGKVGIDQTTPGTTNKVSLGSDVVHTIVDSGSTVVTQGTAGNLNMTEASASAIKTAVELIDDAIYVDDTATHTTGTSKGIGIMAVAVPTDTAISANDIGMVAMSLDRRQLIDANIQQGDADVAAGNPLQVSLANHAANATAVKVNVASGGIASGGIASGAIASGAIAAGAITAGNTSIATTEDTARAAGEHLVKVGLSRLDVPVANANVTTDGDYTNFIADNYGKLWISGSVPEDTAHVAGEALSVTGSRRINTLATSAGSDADWATVNQSAEGAAWSTLSPTTTSGLSVANFNSGDTYTALTSTAQVIKATAGNLYGYYIMNPNTTTSYVLIYNIAAASVTVGTSTAQCVFAIPAGAAANLMMPYPISFTNAGWSIAATTTGGGNTAPSTALECMIWYK